MSAPAFSYTAVLNTNLSTPTVVVTDTTDYTGFDVTLMLAIIQENNNGTPFYQNVGWTTPSWASPDLNGSTSTLSFTNNLPLAPSTTQVPLGIYTFVIIPYYNGAAQPAVTVTVPYTFSLPVPDLNIGYSCEAGQLRASDNTDYSDVIGATLQVINGNPSIVRTMTLTYPQGSGQSPVVTPNPLITIGANTANQFWTGDYQLTVSSVVTYILPNNSTIVVTITGYQSSGKISCDSNLCGIRGCIYSVFQKWIGYCGNNAAQAEYYLNLYTQCEGYWADIIRSRECGLAEQVQNDFCKLKELLKGEQCGCPPGNSDSPIRIFPLNTIPLNCVVAAGTDIAVAVVTVGNTTTYTVSLSSGFLSTITTIQGNITSINASIVTLTAAIAAIVSSKYLKKWETDTEVSTTTSGLRVLDTYTLPLNSLVNVGDSMVIKGFYVNDNVGDQSIMQIKAINNSVDMINYAAVWNNAAVKFEFEISLLSNSTYYVKMNLKTTDYLFVSEEFDLPFTTNGTGVDFAGHTTVISWCGQSETSPYTGIHLFYDSVELKLK